MITKLDRESILVTIMGAMILLGLFYYGDQYLVSPVREEAEFLTETVESQETLQENQYPMYELTSDLASAVPNEAARIVNFNLTEPNQVSLVLENTQTNLARDIVEELDEKTYVDSVQFLSATTETQEDNDMRFELTIQINADNFVEEETE